MKRIRRPFLVFTTLIFTVGGVGTGVALVQIHQMNNFHGALVKETIALSQPITTSSDYTSVALGEVIGIISIPKLDEIYPIVQGTDDKDLKKGVGHYVNSVMPGAKDNTVLAGHRDSVFSRLGRLIKGDLVIIKTRSGTFKYFVTKTRIVMANDRTVIVPTPEATLTLSTCYPFHYIGSAPKRFIVSAKLMS